MNKLLKKLKATKYNKKNVLKFKHLVFKLESTRPVRHPYQILLKGHGCVSKKYMYSVNNKKSFKIIKKFKVRDNCIIPLHINNKVTDKKHLNLLIVKNKKVTRIDVSSQKHTKIKEKNITSSLKRFFSKQGYKYIGMDKRSNIIRHGGLCKYVTPLEYIYGKKINHRIIKKEIIKFFSKK